MSTDPRTETYVNETDRRGMRRTFHSVLPQNWAAEDEATEGES